MVALRFRALLDVYTMHAVAIPYYAGIIRHKANGAIASLHAAAVAEVGWSGTWERLAAYKPYPPAALIRYWSLYLLTVWLAGSLDGTRDARRAGAVESGDPIRQVLRPTPADTPGHVSLE